MIRTGRIFTIVVSDGSAGFYTSLLLFVTKEKTNSMKTDFPVYIARSTHTGTWSEGFSLAPRTSLSMPTLLSRSNAWGDSSR